MVEVASTQNVDLESASTSAPVNTPVADPKPTPAPSPAYSGVAYSPEFNWLREREVSEYDLDGLSVDELQVLFNAIYAMHGYKFKKTDLYNYFSQYDWYHPRSSNVERELSSLERRNVKTIKQRWNLMR